MKIKNSVKKKLLTGLLIGTTLSGVVSTNVFAYSNSNSVQYASKEASDKLIKEIKEAYKSRSSVFDYAHYGYPDNCWLIAKGGRLYEIGDNGRAVMGLDEVFNRTFYFNKYTFASERGWYNVTDAGPFYNGRYYFSGSGALENGIHNVGSERFYFDDKGRVQKGLMEVNGKTYRGDDRAGVLVNGWWSEGGRRYLFEDSNDCAAHEGWYDDGNAGRMYFHNDGSMADGINRIDGDTYLFQHHGRGANSYVATGYYSDTTTDKRYYFDPSDDGKAAKNEWILTNGGYMHFGSDGAMAKGVQVIDGDTFVFTKGRGHDENYYRDLGWYTDRSNDKRYYFGGYRGEALKNGVYWIDGCKCKFDNEGVFRGYVN